MHFLVGADSISARANMEFAPTHLQLILY